MANVLGVTHFSATQFADFYYAEKQLIVSCLGKVECMNQSLQYISQKLSIPLRKLRTSSLSPGMPVSFSFVRRSRIAFCLDLGAFGLGQPRFLPFYTISRCTLRLIGLLQDARFLLFMPGNCGACAPSIDWPAQTAS